MKNTLDVILVDKESKHVIETMSRTFQLTPELLVRRLLGLTSIATVDETVAKSSFEPVREIAAVSVGAAQVGASMPEIVSIYALYCGVRVEGRFEPATNRTWVDSDPLAGKRFSSPSAAAVEVVQNINPNRNHANTNGRLFWMDTRTGRPIGTFFDRP